MGYCSSTHGTKNVTYTLNQYQYTTFSAGIGDLVPIMLTIHESNIEKNFNKTLLSIFIRNILNKTKGWVTVLRPSLLSLMTIFNSNQIYKKIPPHFTTRGKTVAIVVQYNALLISNIQINNNPPQRILRGSLQQDHAA